MSLRARWLLAIALLVPVLAFLGVGVIHDHVHTRWSFATDRPAELVRSVMTAETAPAPWGFRVDSLESGGMLHHVSGGPATGDIVYTIETSGDSAFVSADARVVASSLVSRSILAIELWMDPPDFTPIEEAIAIAQPVLPGYWAPDSTDQMLWFQPDGRMSWMVNGIWIHGLTWTADRSTSPARLDIAGFTDGPLAGRHLFGIFELDGDREMRFDAEAGDAGSAAWPESFTGSTVTYRRSSPPRTEPVLRQQDP